jgi:hypothetical protein
VDVHDYSYLAGPRVNFRPVFVHALIGGDHLTGSALLLRRIVLRPHSVAELSGLFTLYSHFAAIRRN